MLNSSSNLIFVEKYLSDTYIIKNLHSNPFSNQYSLYRAEFGDALGWAGIKTHAKNWLKFFKVLDIKISVLNDEKGMIACDYIETTQQISTFKTIRPISKKIVTVKNRIALGIESQKITYYCLVKDIQELTLQLVGKNQDKYKEIANAPIFSHPYDLHIDIIIEHLEQNQIFVTKPQAQYLCGYFMGVDDIETRKIFGMISPNNILDQEIQAILKCNDWSNVHKKIHELGLAKLLAEAFTLLRTAPSSSNNDLQSYYQLPMCFTDNIKYLF